MGEADKVLQDFKKQIDEKNSTIMNMRNQIDKLMQDLQNYSLNGADKDAKFGEMAQ